MNSASAAEQVPEPVTPEHDPDDRAAASTGDAQSGLDESGLDESGVDESGIAESGVAESGGAESGIAELASALRLVLIRAARRMRLERTEVTITLSQLSALATAAQRGPLSAGEMAALERVQPPSMTKILSSLEAQGLISRVPLQSDRRQSMIATTPAGEALLEHESRARDAWLAGRLAGCSPEELAALRAAIPVLVRIGTS